MGKISKIIKTAQTAKQITTIQKSINQCPICREHQNAIKEHCLASHKTKAISEKI